MTARASLPADSDLRRLTAGVMDATSPQPFGVYAFASHQAGAELGRHIERVVFQDAFGNSPDLLAREYGPYEDQSLFLVAVDHRRQLPAGMMRVVLPGAGGSKSLDDLESVWDVRAEEIFGASGAELDRGRVWDVATLAVATDYRRLAARGVVSLALNQALMGALRRFQVDQVVAILDVAVLRLLQRQLGRPFSMLDGLEPMPYLGSGASLAVWSDVPAWRARLAVADPAMHALLFEGRGLEAAVSAARWGDDARQVALVGMPGSRATVGL
jgi:hypothetical protein